MAGILLKNIVSAKSAELRKSLHIRWLGIPDNERAQMRSRALQLLTSPSKTIRDTSTLVVARLAAVEIPARIWLDLPDTLISGISSQSVEVCISAYKTIGLLCEEVPDHMREWTNKIFTAVFNSLGNDSVHPDVMYEALVTLNHTIAFAEEIMTNDEKRIFVLKIIISTAQRENNMLKAEAWNCLNCFAENYYEYIHTIMGSVIQLFISTMENESVDMAVKLRAVEFWCTLAELEIEFVSRVALASKTGMSVENNKMQCLVQKSIPSVAPILIKNLAKQTEENFEYDVCNEASISATCLQLIAQVNRDNLVPLVEEFMKLHIESTDWHFREASLCAFGLLLEGESSPVLEPLVGRAFDIVLSLCTDDMAYLRDTASWVLARLCRIFPAKVRTSQPVLQLLSTMLTAKPREAANACWGIYCLSESVSGGGLDHQLTCQYELLVTNLLNCSKRSDKDEEKLISKSYEALNALISSSSASCLEINLKLLKYFADRLKETFSISKVATANGQNSAEINNLQSHIISALSTIIKILPNEEVIGRINEIMEILFTVLQSNDKTIFEEVLISVGVIINKIGENFTPFVLRIFTFIEAGLKGQLGPNGAEAAIGIVSDIFRVLGSKMANQKVSDDFVKIMLEILIQNTDRKVTLAVIVCLGDVAISVNSGFERYFLPSAEAFVKLLTQSAQFNTFEDQDYFYSMWQYILETCSLILHAMSGSPELKSKFLCFCPKVLDIVDLLVNNRCSEPPVIAAALCFVGDSVDILGKSIINQVDRPSVITLKQVSGNLNDPRVQKAFQWFSTCVNRISGNPSSFF